MFMEASPETLRRTPGPRLLYVLAVVTFARCHISITALPSLARRNELTSCDRIRTSAPSPQAAILCGLGIHSAGNESAERTHVVVGELVIGKRGDTLVAEM